MEASHIGRFMVAIGALIRHPVDARILIVKRSSAVDFQQEQWEIPYGRLDQFEDTIDAIRRETREELGYTDIGIGDPLRIWHIFRGERKAETEVIGITYLCTAKTETVTLSAEHEQYRWVTPEEALTLIGNDGIRQDIRAYLTRPAPTP
jgi:8-oxo-dGTP diphosphatase